MGAKFKTIKYMYMYHIKCMKKIHSSLHVLKKTCRKCMQLHVQCTSKLNKKQDYIKIVLNDMKE